MAVETLQLKVTIWAADMAHSIAFYRDAFGAELLRESPVISELSLGSGLLAIHNGGDGQRTWTGLTLEVADVYAAAQAVRKAGGTLRQEPEDENGEPAHLAMCIDPDGNEFMVFRKR